MADAVLDARRLAELEAEIGADGVAIVVEAFVEEAGEMLAELGARHATEGREATAARLHFLAGAALNVGAARLAAICRRLEGSDDPVAAADVAALDAALAAVREGAAQLEQ